MEINVYLYFNGNCEEAMNFYKDAMGGSIANMVRYGEAPMPTKEEWKNRVMHGVLSLDTTSIFFSDSSEHGDVSFGNNFAVSLSFKSDAEITNAFNALSTGGQVTMPLQDTFWNAKFGMCTDKFGVNWMFNWDKPKS